MRRGRLARLSSKRMVIGVGSVLTALTLVVTPATVGASPRVDAGAQGVGWARTHDGPQQYPGVAVQWNVPIRMSDGTVLRGNIYRPADRAQRPIAKKTPVILNLTPYTKMVTSLAVATLQNPVLEPYLKQILNAIQLGGTPLSGFDQLIGAARDGGVRNFAVDTALVRSGYTQVVVDVRGTGWSQGRWNVFQSREQQDSVEVIDWAAKQSWSDGRVGMSGVSYSGINQIQAANKRPKALKAIFPVEPGGDLIRDIVAPGGALGVGFLPMWLTLVNTTKMIPNVASMLNGTFDWKWLADRVADPVTFFPQLFAALLTPDIPSVPKELKELLEDGTEPRESWQARAEQINVPTFIYGGWFDLFTNSEVRMFNKIPLPAGQKQLLMGDGYHLTIGGGQGGVGRPPRLDVLQRAWFDKWIKGIDNGIETYGPATLKQVGDRWIRAQQFPRAGMERQRLYLTDRRSGTAAHAVRDGGLSTGKPNSRARFTVAPNLWTLCSRDATQQMAGALAIFPFCSDNAWISEHGALSFTTAPVRSTRSVSGYSNLRLNAVMDATDGYYTATLNDVAPDGTSKVISSGQIMASLRAIDPAQSTFAANGDVIDPFYKLTLSSRQRVTPGRPVTLDIGLLPTEALIRAGHRLRIDVFASNFPRGLQLRPLLNESQLRPIHIQLDPNQPSFVNIPLSEPLP